MSTPPRRNVELKALDPDPAASLAACRSLGAADQGELWQRDTYFPVSHGRLKLREQRPGGAQLIQYARTDQPQERESRYRLVEIGDPATLIDVLSAALGIAVVVTKRRLLFLWQEVRIHLDDVEGLGQFVELEAVADRASDLSREHELVTELRAALGITEARLVEHGYADLLLGTREPTSSWQPPATAYSTDLVD
jgi:adenylate cyclase, class 2